jgi:trimeric autotransporter adhesin
MIIPLIQFKQTTSAFVIAVALLAFLPKMQTVSPAPDGCYPNYTTAEGCSALQLLSTGSGNTGLGWYSLYLDTTGSFNTGVGGGALALNNADSNTAVGAAALLLNTTGTLNTAVGTDALVFNDSGSDNNAFGAFALFNNNGSFNNAHGRIALNSNADGIENNAFGDRALRDNVSGSHNTATGDDALLVSTGDGNTAMGEQAGNTIVDGTENVCIGDGAGGGLVSANNNIAIGVPAAGPFLDLDDTCYIGSIHDEPISDAGSAQAVYVDQFNVLGFLPSSQRFKHDITPMDKASEVLYGLKPVTFKYNNDTTARTQYGVIAEEVAKVAPDLVFRDKNGTVETVRFEQISAMLLNEFLKEHSKVEKLKNDFQSRVAQQQKEIAALTAMVKEQASEIQKVSAQLELSKSAPQTVRNDR